MTVRAWPRPATSRRLRTRRAMMAVADAVPVVAIVGQQQRGQRAHPTVPALRSGTEGARCGSARRPTAQRSVRERARTTRIRRHGDAHGMSSGDRGSSDLSRTTRCPREDPPALHAALVRAYIAGASHRGLARRRPRPLAAPWVGATARRCSTASRPSPGPATNSAYWTHVGRRAVRANVGAGALRTAAPLLH